MAGVGPRLELRQGQSLVMTPQLQQAIKLLQLSNVELAEYCEAELEKNPLLERDDREAQPVTDAPEAATETAAANERTDQALTRDDFSKTSEMDEAAHDNMYDGGEPRKQAEAPVSGSLTDWTTVKSGNSYDGEDGLESSIAADASLKDHLESQLSIAALLPEDRLILLALIDAVDETGYLRGDLLEMSSRLGCEIEDVQAVLGVLHGFDPVGVGARDLAECLSLQLKAKDRPGGVRFVVKDYPKDKEWRQLRLAEHLLLKLKDHIATLGLNRPGFDTGPTSCGGSSHVTPFFVPG